MRTMADAEYIRGLEDACLLLWQEMPVAQVLILRAELPDMCDFLAHLHHSIDHEQAMVRQPVWGSQLGRERPVM